MDDNGSRAADDFNGACLAGDDGRADRAASSPALQRAVLGPALRVPEEPNGNIRCPACHDGFACSGPEGHDGIHWNGALWWDGEHADAPAAEEVAMVPTVAAETVVDFADGVRRLVAARNRLDLELPNPLQDIDAVMFDLARMARVRA